MRGTCSTNGFSICLLWTLFFPPFHWQWEKSPWVKRGRRGCWVFLLSCPLSSLQNQNFYPRTQFRRFWKATSFSGKSGYHTMSQMCAKKYTKKKKFIREKDHHNNFPELSTYIEKSHRLYTNHHVFHKWFLNTFFNKMFCFTCSSTLELFSHTIFCI